MFLIQKQDLGPFEYKTNPTTTIAGHFATKEHNFKVLYQNIQSINNKQHLLEAYLHENSTYHAICISETWLSNDKLSLIQLSGYKVSAAFCREARTGGGVCILLQDHIEYTPREDITKFSIEYVLEMCAIELTEQKTILITMYWNRREEDLFYNTLKQTLDYINIKYSGYNIILGGDFNINILVDNPKSIRFINTMLEYKFTQLIKVPTHVTQTASTCLDLIFTNFEHKDTHTAVEELGFSDHSGTILCVKIPQQFKKQIVWQVEKRQFNTKNIENFRLELTNLDWESIITHDKNVNENYTLFAQTLNSILDKCIPKRNIKLKTNYKKHWLTTGIKLSCRNKRLLKLLTLKSSSHVIKKYYKSYEKILKRSVITSRKLYYANKIKKSSNKIKTMWSIINERTNKKLSKNKTNIELQINNNLVSEPRQVAGNFNSFFASIGDNTNCAATGRPVLQQIENSMFLVPVSYQETVKIMKNMKNKNSHGIDELPPSLIRHCAYQLAIPLCLLINQSFKEGSFPELLKVAIIKPIHKKNTKTDPNNYRPIALLPTASKVFEKAMCNRIYGFCEKYKIFNECQNGFRKQRSTVLAVYKYIQEILNILNSKQYAIGILLDMTKAYDKVQHSILLQKLYGIGIRGNAFKWLSSYLKDRKQLVEIEHFNHKTGKITLEQSEIKILNASIPQGSVIGCLLFLIYINDLPKITKEKCVLFADDVSIITACQNDINLNEKLNSIFNEITTWMRDHNLEINFPKTKIMTFHPYQKTPLSINYEYNNIQLEIVQSFTLLGIDIDRHITWKFHINKIKVKLSRFVYALREVKKSTNLETALSTYYAYAYAWLTYGIMLWGNSTDAPSVFTIQKKLIRILVNIKQTDSCKPYFKKHKLLTLPSIYIFETCKFVRKHKELYVKRDDFPSSRPIRNKNRLVRPPAKLTLLSSGPLIMSIKIYNNLPDSIKEEEDDKKYINKIKQLLLTKSYYTLNEYLEDKL
jgi:hypothetical protein